MDLLKDFCTKDMIEQISILDELKESSNTEALPALMELYGSAIEDKAVDEILYYTIYDLLNDHNESVLEGLKNTSERIRLLCVRKVNEKVIPEAMPDLVDLLRKESDTQLIGEIIRALGKYQDASLVNIILPFIRHEDYTIAGWAFEVLPEFGGTEIRDAVILFIKEHVNEVAEEGDCDLRLAMAIESLGNFPDDVTIAFLVTHIHHANPTFRRLVITTLIRMGQVVLPALEGILETGDKDEKIMAANIIGLLGDRQGADLLVATLDNGGLEPNFKFAIYEALGRISSIRSIIGLADGLVEKDELALIAVVDGLEKLFNPGVVKVLNEKVAAGDEQTKRILEAVVAARARKIFIALNKSDIRSELYSVLVKSKDQEAIQQFQAALQESGDDAGAAEISELPMEDLSEGQKLRVVAADDSNAMLFFYKSASAELGLELTTAKDGVEALEHFKSNPEVDLLITDMNMPNMTGIELAIELRKIEKYGDLPIMMATTESDESQKDIARQAGITDFISKPFSKAEFQKKMADYLN